MKGRPPKDASQRQRRNPVPAVETLEALPADTEYPPLVGEFSKQTILFYATLATSAQASKWTPSDWLWLQMLMPIVEQYYAEPSVRLLSELRQSLGKLGVTPEDRMRMRWKIEPEGGAADQGESPPPSKARPDPRTIKN